MKHERRKLKFGNASLSIKKTLEGVWLVFESKNKHALLNLNIIAEDVLIDSSKQKGILLNSKIVGECLKDFCQEVENFYK